MKFEFSPAELESKLRIEFLSTLKPGAHIHICGICGTGTSAVAELLKKLGFYVTGSDKAFYPPIGEIVRKIADEIYEGYGVENLKKRPAAVVIGNALSRDNPEVQEVLAQGIPYASMPEVFSALLIGTRAQCKTSIVVSGTHGKTTTTSAVAVMFDKLGFNPGYFIGGVPLDLSSALRSVDRTLALEKRLVVLEGDEYDSAFFAKWSKFHSYRPDILVITSLEFDHADIFETLAEIEAEFAKLVFRMPEGSKILVSDENPKLIALVDSWLETGELKAEVFFYGTSSCAKFKLLKREARESKQNLLLDLNGEVVDVVSNLTGQHNALNLLAAGAVASLFGAGFSKEIQAEEIARALCNFHGVLRRQQLLGEFKGIKLIEDFAHHPTAVATTLDGLRESYPKCRIIAVFEPRSNTSRLAVFQDAYKKSFAASDVVIIQEIAAPTGYSKTKHGKEQMDVHKLVSELNAAGKTAVCLSNTDEILEFLIERSTANDLIVLMSNGSFGGLPLKLVEAFSS